MNILQKPKTILLFCFVLLLLSAGIFTAAYFVHARQEILLTKEKRIDVTQLAWRRYDVDRASNDAITIVYGTMGPKSKLKKEEVIREDGSVVATERYKEAEIRVIQIIKGDPDAKTVLYREPSGEVTEDTIYLYHRVIFLQEGKDYLLFLDRNGMYLSPDTAIEVDKDGTITPVRDMRLKNEAQARSNESLSVSLDDYIAEVQRCLE